MRDIRAQVARRAIRSAEFANGANSLLDGRFTPNRPYDNKPTNPSRCSVGAYHRPQAGGEPAPETFHFDRNARRVRQKDVLSPIGALTAAGGMMEGLSASAEPSS